ncbi:MAG TPA: YXWGXW repeat-containing protein [Xanthobacteraceae bacterium]|nr:YXWGXW repeat-containing protein [Xanthobacteraceae bacterium]
MRSCRPIALSLLFILAMIAVPAISSAQIAVDVAVTIEPPALPVYDQPEIPGPGYIWTPGYWAYGPEGYFWVPGTWVEAPAPELLWTPGYWGFGDGGYFWHEGYWGPHIGFYGGINYGFGYVGVGYLGGAWRGGVFTYNTAVTNIGSVHITNVYHETIVNRAAVTTVSFNGGAGGVVATPTAQEQAAAHEHHIAPTTAQTQHVTAASTNRALLASVNQGKPAIAATGKPGQFTGHGVVAATQAGKEFRGSTNPAAVGKTAPGGAVHPDVKDTKAKEKGRTYPATATAPSPPVKNAKVTPPNAPKATPKGPRPAVARTPPKAPPKKPKQG